MKNAQLQTDGSGTYFAPNKKALKLGLEVFKKKIKEGYEFRWLPSDGSIIRIGIYKKPSFMVLEFTHYHLDMVERWEERNVKKVGAKAV